MSTWDYKNCGVLKLYDKCLSQCISVIVYSYKFSFGDNFKTTLKVFCNRPLFHDMSGLSYRRILGSQSNMQPTVTSDPLNSITSSSDTTNLAILNATDTIIVLIHV